MTFRSRSLLTYVSPAVIKDTTTKSIWVNSMTMKFFLSLSVAVILSVSVAVAAAATDSVPDVNGYPSTGVEVQKANVYYPIGRWKIVKQEDIDENTSVFSLQAKSSSLVILHVVVTSYEEDISDADYDNHPNSVNTSFLLSMTESFPVKKGTQLQYSIGTVNMPSYWNTSTRVNGTLSNDKECSIEACHEFDEDTNTMLIVAVQTEGLSSGGLLEDSNYPELVAEAYAIVEEIAFEK